MLYEDEIINFYRELELNPYRLIDAKPMLDLCIRVLRFNGTLKEPEGYGCGSGFDNGEKAHLMRLYKGLHYDFGSGVQEDPSLEFLGFGYGEGDAAGSGWHHSFPDVLIEEYNSEYNNEVYIGGAGEGWGDGFGIGKGAEIYSDYFAHGCEHNVGVCSGDGYG